MIQVVNSPEQVYPLSPMQQGMLFHSLYTQQPGMYVEQIVATLAEDLHVTAFERAWQRLVARQAIFRTGFEWQNLDEPQQRVHPQIELPLARQDWRGLSTQEQAESLERYLQADRQRGFLLTEAPLMRLALFRTAQASYCLVWTFHHLLLDGRGMVLALNELFAFYEAFRLGQDLQLPSPPPYQAYITWLQRQEVAGAERFWRQALQGFTAPTPLVIAQPAPSRSDLRETDSHAEQRIRLSAAVTSALQALTQSGQFTLNTILQGAWALLLSRYSGETDIVFGATRACRRSANPGAVDTIGLFINTLPVRVQVSPDLKLLPWLQAIRRQQLAVRPYEHTPLVQVQAWSELPAGMALFETMLNFQSLPWDAPLRAQGGPWQQREFQVYGRTNYPLVLEVYGGPQLLLALEYDQQRFDEATMTRLLGHLQTLLEGMAANPEVRLLDLPMLTEAERRQLLIEWTHPRLEAASEQPECIQQRFEAQVERSPEAVALIYGQEQLTYRELNRRANQLAHHLQALGVGPEVLVGLCLERSPEMIIALLAVLKAGGAYVPLDPAYPPERLAFILADAHIAVLLTQQQIAEQKLKIVNPYPPDGPSKIQNPRPPDGQSKIQNLKSKIQNPLVVCLDLDWPAIAQECPDNPPSGVMASNLAYVIYTSGSTGLPKGVMIEHRALVNFVEAAVAAYAITPADRVLQFASLSFDTSAEEIYPCLTQGAALILRSDDMLSSTVTFLESCRDLAVTVLDLPTAYWHQLAMAKLALPEPLRLVIIGGEAAQPEPLRLWFEHVSPAIRLVNTYGPTEATIVATLGDLTK